MEVIIGTCSLCGGVVIDKKWSYPPQPIPTCQSCGATKKNPHGVIIDMEPETQVDARICKEHMCYPCRKCGTKHYVGCQCTYCKE